MNHSIIARILARGIRLFAVATLLAGLAVALQLATPAVRAGPAYQPPTNNVYLIHAGAYVDINTPIGASPGPADDAGSGAANCTLRDALGIVNAGNTSGTVNGCTITQVGAPAGNIYRINLPTGGYTYTLDPANGELLTSANTLYIVGDTAANTIIQANAAPNTATYRVLRNNGATVELGNVIIRHGRCAGACAGIGGSGGGLYNQSGTTTVDNSIVSDNTAAWGGGGICNEATLNVQSGSTIGGAGAGNQANDDGGGIYNLNGTTTVSGSTVSANWASLRGGGIYNRATLNIQNGSTIGGAGAGNQAHDGGGIYNWWIGTTAVDGSTVSANTADRGGGIYNQATLNIQNGSTIGGAGAGNQATLLGGGIYNPDGTTTMDGSTVSANRATVQGGGIYNMATLNIQNGSTIGGAGAGNQAFAGGGICNWAGITTVDASTVSANTATFGGGIANGATLNVQNGSTIGGTGVGNMADTGGGINNVSGTTTVDASTVSANRATNDGGGIYNQAMLNVWNSTIGGAGVGNQADFGGGIFNDWNWPGGTTVVMGSRVLYNTATTIGGGVYNDRDEVGATGVTDSCIVGNSATSFLNNQAAQQTATGNWWGAATGPNTPCADTTSGNVDTTGFLAAPILGCPTGCPDLQVSKANDTGGNGKVGTPFHWTLTVTNLGGTDATFTAGQRIVEDDLPAGPTYGPPVFGNSANITNTVNIICGVVVNTLTCDAVGADVTIGATTGGFTVVFSVMPNSAGILNNPRSGGNCRVDPNNHVAESSETNNNCPANGVNVAAPPRPPSDDKDDEEPPPVPPPKAQEFNCWPWLVIVPSGAAPNAVPGEWCQASLGKPLLGTSNFRYLGHSTEVSIKDAAGVAVTSFAQPIKVCFRYTQPELDAVGGDPANFLLQVFLDGQWETLDTKPDSGLSYPGVCAPVDHLTLFALFARDGADPDASVAPASDSTLLFPTHLPETGARPASPWTRVGGGLMAILLMGIGVWLMRRR